MPAAAKSAKPKRKRARKTRTAAALDASSSSSSSSSSESESEDETPTAVAAAMEVDSDSDSSSTSSSSSEDSAVVRRRNTAGRDTAGVREASSYTRGQAYSPSPSPERDPLTNASSIQRDYTRLPAPRIPTLSLPTAAPQVRKTLAQRNEEHQRERELNQAREAKEKKLREEAFRGFWMRAVVSDFGEELDTLRKRDPALSAGDSTRLPLLIDSLGAGAELFNSTGSVTASSKTELFEMRTQGAEEHAQEGVDEIKLVLGAGA